MFPPWAVRTGTKGESSTTTSYSTQINTITINPLFRGVTQIKRTANKWGTSYSQKPQFSMFICRILSTIWNFRLHTKLFYIYKETLKIAHFIKKINSWKQYSLKRSANIQKKLRSSSVSEVFFRNYISFRINLHRKICFLLTAELLNFFLLRIR